MKSKGEETSTSPIILINSTDSNRKSNNSIGGDVFMGYRHIFENGLLAGVDLAISWDGNRVIHVFNHHNTFLTHTRLSTPYKFIPGVVLGTRFLERYLAFVKLGVSIAQFRAKHRFDVKGNTITTNAFRKRQVGFFGSAGVECALTQNLSTVATVSYEHYGKIKNTMQNIPNDVPDESGTISLQPRAFAAKIGLVFRFNCADQQ